jgi:hypothetical protein
MPAGLAVGLNRFVNQLTLTSQAVGSFGSETAMHKVAVAFFYTCAALSITFTALVFMGIASA